MEIPNFYSLGLGISSRCNLKCPHCYYNNHNVGIFMTPQFARMLMRELPPLRSVIVGLEGEPLLHPGFHEILEALSGRAQAISLVTNGTLLKESICRDLLQFPIGSLAISIEAGTRESYERFRRGADFATFLRHADLAARYLEERASFHVTMFRQNLDDIPTVLDLAKNLGVKRISFQLLRPSSAIKERGIDPAPEKRIKTCIAKVLEKCEGLLLHFPPDFASPSIMDFLRDTQKVCLENIQPEKSEKGCQIIRHFASILADGRIFPCCGDFAPLQPQEHNFYGIYNHPFMLSLRQKIAQGHPPAACAVCGNLKR